MTTNPYRALTLFLLLVTGLGCEKTVIVDVPPHERQIVAKALFNPDSLWRVNVSSSVGFQDAIYPFPLLNAAVEIWEEGALLETLQHVESGFYVAQQTRPQPGKTYTLRVAAPGYEAVEASASLPAASAAPQMSVEALVDTYETPLLNVSVTIDDPADEQNYYAIDVLLRMTNGHGEEAVTFQSRVGFESNDVVLRGVEAFDDDTEYFNVAYFEDDLFDGQSQTISLSTFNQSVFDPEGRITSTLILRVYVTDEAYFRYHKTIELQDELDENPFAEPVRIHSNMSNGFGIFAGYRVYSMVLAQW